jgi:hypothetical protein
MIGTSYSGGGGLVGWAGIGQERRGGGERLDSKAKGASDAAARAPPVIITCSGSKVLS